MPSEPLHNFVSVFSPILLTTVFVESEIVTEVSLLLLFLQLFEILRVFNIVKPLLDGADVFEAEPSTVNSPY